MQFSYNENSCSIQKNKIFLSKPLFHTENKIHVETDLSNTYKLFEYKKKALHIN